MNEHELFKKIFLDNRDDDVNYALLTHPSHSWRTIAQPTYEDWKDVLKEFSLIDCFIDTREHNMSQLWLDGNLSEKYHSIPYGSGVLKGLDFLKDLQLIDKNDEADFDNLFARFYRMLVLCSDLIEGDVKSPPVLSNVHRNTIHPGSTISQSHQIIDKPLRIILMKPKDESRIEIPVNILKVNKYISTLEDLEKSYEGNLLGFIERIAGRIKHLHLYSYHSSWEKPDDRGYVEYPKFDAVKFLKYCNDNFPDTCESVTVRLPRMTTDLTFKVTNDSDLIKQAFIYGKKECFI